MSANAAYMLADSLLMKVDLKEGLLYGETRRDVDFGKMRVGFPIKIVSSMIINNDLMVLCEVLGDLGLCVFCKGQDINVMILDCSKIDQIKDMLESCAFQEFHEVIPWLAPGVVATYHRKWSEHKFKKVR